MKTYKSFGALARALDRVSLNLESSLAIAMEQSAALVEATAKSEFGHYQRTDMGPFAEWLELKAATKKDRLRQGYTENDPLLRSGKLRESVDHISAPFEFVVGSEDPVMVYQELGTSRGIPPRPVLAPALYRNVHNILNIVGKTIETTLAGEMP